MTAELETLFSEPSFTHCDQNSSESGKTLTEVIRNIRHRHYEVVALFDAYGNKICEHTNHQQEYAGFMLPEKWIAKANLMVHNHLADGTFSPPDLLSNAIADINVSMIVSPSCNFYLFRPTTGWPDMEELLTEYDTIIQIMQHKPRHNYDLEAARHLALLKVAQHYNIKYKVEAASGANLPATFAVSE